MSICLASCPYCIRKLCFFRADTLGDPFEGSAPHQNSLEGIKEAIARRKDDKSFAFMPELTDEQLFQAFSQLADARKRFTSQMYVNCWHMNSNESYAMWKLYGRYDEAIALQTDFETLDAALPDYVMFGALRYIDYRTDFINAGNLLNAFIHKRKSFENEQEIRGVIWAADDTRKANPKIPDIQGSGILVPIEFNKAFQAVRVSPLAPNWLLSIVTDVRQKYQVTIPIIQSDMSKEPMS